MDDPRKHISAAYYAVLFVGALSLLAGLITWLFEIRFLQGLGLGWSSVLFGLIFLLLAYYTKQHSFVALALATGFYVLDAFAYLLHVVEFSAAAAGMGFRILILLVMGRGMIAIRRLKKGAVEGQIAHPPFVPSVSSNASSHAAQAPIHPVSLAVPSAPESFKPVSFVAPIGPTNIAEAPKRDLLSKSITPEILNLRFVAYRCEIAVDHVKAIYQNASQTEMKWFEVSSLVIRQFPFQSPWEGKLLLDIVPLAVAGEKIQPVRILSSTYVNYGFLPQGQSASAKENMRRMATFILSRNRSIFIDPGTDYFIHAGQPPVRFINMSQFTEYDARYS
jgi:hypothetical protein